MGIYGSNRGGGCGVVPQWGFSFFGGSPGGCRKTSFGRHVQIPIKVIYLESSRESFRLVYVWVQSEGGGG